ncbi:MAG: serine/threonine protein phosphatase PrpC [Granulosicoccus sp.]|jgi:serine/threonine protein phosphatase PrpC
MWQSNSYTDTGKVRSLNEDSILDLNEQNLWLVADGMGGHSSGDYASQLVTSTLSNYIFSPRAGICKARLVADLDSCNAQLIEKADSEQADVIGCTVAALQARQTSILCTWSGDSRIYRLRGDVLMELTRDHSHQCAVEDRDLLLYPRALSEHSQMLTGAIGGAPQLALEHCWYQLQAGDAFLICTDGLNKEVSDEEIREAMLDSDSGEQVLNALAQMYQDRGARDNIGLVWLREGST